MHRSRQLDIGPVKKRLPSRISHKTTFISGTTGVVSSQVSSSSTGHDGSSGIAMSKGSGGSGQKCTKSRFLQPLLRGSQEEAGRLALHSGSKCLKQVCDQGKVPHGVGREYSPSIDQGTLVNVPGSHGRLLSHNDPPSRQEISTLYGERSGLSISGSSYGPYFFPKNLYESDQSDKGICTKVRINTLPVSRRLADTGAQSGYGSTRHKVSHSNCTRTRMDRQCRQVRVGPYTDLSFPRLPVYDAPRFSSSFTRQVGQAQRHFTTVSGEQVFASQDMAAGDWTLGFHREAGAPGDAPSSAPSTFPRGPVVPVQRQPGGSGFHFTGGEVRGKMVAQGREHTTGSSDQSEYREGTTIVDVYRRQPGRLGRSSERSYSSGNLDTRGDRTAHQRTGDAGSSVHTSSFYRGSQRPDSTSQFRQFDYGQLHTSPRRNQVLDIVPRVTGPVEVGSGASGFTSMQAHCRKTQRGSRQTVTGRGDYSLGMVTERQSFGQDVVVVGAAHDRSFLHTGQPQDGHLRISDTRSSSTGDGCIVHQLGRDARLRVSPHSHIRESVAQNQSGELHNRVDSTAMGETDVVSTDSGVIGGRTSSVAMLSENVKATSIHDISQEPQNIQPTCVETITQSLEKKGFSATVAKRMAQAQKASSLAVYQGKWTAFTNWCHKRNTDPGAASVPVIAEFLCDLHERKNLAYSTIEGYRTAIGHMLRAVRGEDISKDPHLTNLFANFARDITKRRNSVPSWNLALVLQTMTQPPFEPLEEVSMKMLTLKTVFLFTLASASRRSEIHALTRESLMREEHWQSVSVSPDMNFVAKTELANKGVSVLQSITIKALSTIVGSDLPEDLTLCPVRALRIYLNRTDGIRSDKQKKLFIAFKAGHSQDIHRNTISGWIKKAIVTAHDIASPDTQQLYRVKAHEVRALSTSWAFLRNISLDHIMHAGTWKHHTTFTSYYLKDLTRIKGDMMCLGPLVTAQVIS